MKDLVLPALRGNFGDWTYYVCLMPVTDLAARVHYAREVHSSDALSDMIQRVLEGPRAKAIAEYLDTTEQRFFNSLVLATYGGSPQWFEVGNFKTTTSRSILLRIPETAQESIGFLSLNAKCRNFRGRRPTSSGRHQTRHRRRG